MDGCILCGHRAGILYILYAVWFAAILVDLLTLEVHSYGEESLAGSKVVEHVAPATAAPAAVIGPAVRAPATMIGPAVRPPAAVIGPALRPPAAMIGPAARPPLQPTTPQPVVTPSTFIQPS